MMTHSSRPVLANPDQAPFPSVDPSLRTYLRLIEADDADFLSELRSDTTLSQYLSAGCFSAGQQRVWIETYKAREALGQEYYFVIMCDGSRAGVIRLYDFRCVGGRTSFCFGSWIVKPPRLSGLTTYSILIAFEYGFDHLGFRACHFDVRKNNTTAVSYYDRMGAVRTSESDIDYFYTFTAENYAAFRLRSAAQIALHRVRHGSESDSGRTTRPPARSI